MSNWRGAFHIFLLYKPVGRANKDNTLLQSDFLVEFFKKVRLSRLKIGFDSCSVPAIVNHLNYNPIFLEPCEAGKFSAYISERLNFYPCSFMQHTYAGLNLKNSSMKEAWQNSDLFKIMRTKKREGLCIECDFFSDCKGGCSVYPEINICTPIPNRYL